MYCLNCGAEVPDRRHCPQCGTEFPVELAQGLDMRKAAVAPVLTTQLGPAPRRPPSLLMTDCAPNALFMLLFGGIFGFVGTVLGVVFGLIGAVGGQLVFLAIGAGALLLFGGVGFTVFGFGVRDVRRVRQLWRHGEQVTGELLGAQIDRTVRVNGRHPLRVEFRYRTYSGEFSGRGQSWDRHLAVVPRGTALTVLVDPNDPARAIWVPPSVAGNR